VGKDSGRAEKKLKVGYCAGALGEAQWKVLGGELRKFIRNVEVVPVPIDRGEEPAGLERVFANPLELMLLDREVDIVVASLHEIDPSPPEGVKLAAVTQRDDPREALVTFPPKPLRTLSPGTEVYVDNPRRARQLKRLHGGLVPVMGRMRIDETLAELRSQEGGGAILSLTDLRWIGEEPEVSERISTDSMLPAPGQGALGLLVRWGDAASEKAALIVHHAASFTCATAERECMRRIGCNIYSPAGALARVDDKGTLRLRAAVFGPEGDPVVEAAGLSAPGNAEALGQAVAKELFKKGGEKVLEEARREE
jgi:hydroxymethylbilane synthase